MPDFLKTDLFHQTLLKPYEDGRANRLLIVSGYATPSMASYHLEKLVNLAGAPFSVDILVGMGKRDGILRTQKEGFENISQEYANLNCKYIISGMPVHSKVYSWCMDNDPICGFIGSANYTQTAFLGKNQREILGEYDAQACKMYFETLQPDAAEINDFRVEELLNEHSEMRRVQRPSEVPLEATTHSAVDVPPPTLEGSTVKLGFLKKDGSLPDGASGLNWGQRKGRNPNQAYIPIKAEVARKRFFPPKGQHFTVITDDNRVLICTTAQDSGVEGQGKAIETPRNNSLLGEYFRYRLGLSNGEKILLEHLQRYGRTDVSFSKIDDETYFMDFSPPVA